MRKHRYAAEAEFSAIWRPQRVVVVEQRQRRRITDAATGRQVVATRRKERLLGSPERIKAWEADLAAIIAELG